jgi:hypothetical protein
VPRLQPTRLLLTAIAGRIHREQAATIDYLLEENRALREQLGTRRLRLTDDQRRRLAAKGVALGRRPLDRIATGRCGVTARYTHPGSRAADVSNLRVNSWPAPTATAAA